MSINTIKNEPNMQGKTRTWIIGVILGALIVGFVLIRFFIYGFFSIPASSMSPTINIGDFIIIKKVGYGKLYSTININWNPQRGEIFAFRPPHNKDTIFLKRIIGLPGDIVSFSNKQLVINNKAIESKKLTETIYSEQLDNHLYNVQYQSEFAPFREFSITVPENQYFVMGDNRDNSADSRAWGFVPREDMIGRLVKAL